jgi:hypothetical protein
VLLLLELVYASLLRHTISHCHGLRSFTGYYAFVSTQRVCRAVFKVVDSCIKEGIGSIVSGATVSSFICEEFVALQLSAGNNKYVRFSARENIELPVNARDHIIVETETILEG